MQQPQPTTPFPQSPLCPPPVLRSAKACWLAGHYADIEFGDGQGKGPTFSALLQRVVAAIGGERWGQGKGEQQRYSS